jgi:hypothetical protein
MGTHRRQIPHSFDRIDDDMARVVQGKTGAQRLAIANALFASARQMLLSYLRAEHPDWDEARVRRETARRLSHGSF